MLVDVTPIATNKSDQSSVIYAQAVRKGYKFFDVISNNMADGRTRILKGMMGLTPYVANENIMTHQKEYGFKEAGISTVFQWDDVKGNNIAKVLDVEYNRKFMASMLANDPKDYTIPDEEISKDILARADKIRIEYIADKKRRYIDLASKSEKILTDDQKIELNMLRNHGYAVEEKEAIKEAVVATKTDTPKKVEVEANVEKKERKAREPISTYPCPNNCGANVSDRSNYCMRCKTKVTKPVVNAAVIPNESPTPDGALKIE